MDRSVVHPVHLSQAATCCETSIVFRDHHQWLGYTRAKFSVSQHLPTGCQKPSAHTFRLRCVRRFQSLDLGRLANSFALLRLPKMPEIRDRMLQFQSKGKQKRDVERVGARWHLPHFEPAGPGVDIPSIPFLDPQRESARQKRSAYDEDLGGSRPEKRGSDIIGKGRSVATHEHHNEAPLRDDKFDRKRGRNARLVEEWDDLAKEERLYKKLRKKKITQEQYDAELSRDGGKRKPKYL